MRAEFEGMWPGEPMTVDEQGRKISLTLRIIPETPQEVAELRKFCRMTEAFAFIIDEDYRNNAAHIAPVYAERAFSVSQHELELENLP